MRIKIPSIRFCLKVLCNGSNSNESFIFFCRGFLEHLNWLFFAVWLRSRNIEFLDKFFFERNKNFKERIFWPPGNSVFLSFLSPKSMKLGLETVTTIFWASVLCSLAAEDACFRMRITLGVVLIRSLVFHVCVPECSRNGFGMRLYLLVREKFIYFRQSIRNAGLYPVELLGQFFSDSAFNLLRNLCDIFLVTSRNGRVSWLAVPKIFLFSFSCNGCQLSFVSQRCHLLEGKMLRSYEDWIILYLLINLRL